MEFFKLDKERLKEINKKRNFSYYCRVRRTRTGERLTTSNRIKRNNKKLPEGKYYQIANCGKYGIVIQRTPVIPTFVIEEEIERLEVQNKRERFATGYWSTLAKIRLLKKILERKEGGE